MKRFSVLGLIAVVCSYQAGPVNVAVGKPASQSSNWSAGSTADKAVDGNTETYWSGNSCTATNADPNAWWKVDLQSEHAVDHVVLINREGCCPERLLGAVVRVGNSQDIASNTQCGNPVTTAQISASATITIECPDDTAGQFVSVQLEGQTQFLTLCELQVFGEGTETSGSEWENVAVGKPAWQSSNWSGTSTADKAVDGNANPQWSGNSCTATNQNQDAWWKTDLQSRHTVGQVVLTNRQDCCPERLLGAVVRVGDSDDIASNTQCGSAVTSDQISASETITIDCPEGTKGRYVSVQLEGKNMWLTLCEVEIYGATFVATEAPPTQAPATEAPPTQAPVNPDATTMIPTLAPCEYPAGVKNVAAGRPSRQSSDKKNKDSGSENAVDGDYGTDAHSGSCSWTNKELEPWWTVDLGETKDIYEVSITNREDCCPFRIKNAEIRVGDSQTMEDNPVCGMRVLGRMTKENPIRIRCGCEIPMQGRYVSIKLIDREQQLTLCEVEVLAT
ncbi:uncharacterized protein [Ptychodera flava]|uniref:uncharacterized protein isoform X2 n=1 Tax=Ptychodera flava TaxID=63121 RepID=UPI00396A7E16